MARDRRPCACCGEPVTSDTQRRHLRQKTAKSVLVAQQHNYGEQRRRLLRLEALALPGNTAVAASQHSSEDVSEPVVPEADDDDMGMEDVVFSDCEHPDLLENSDNADGRESDSESGGDPFEGRPDEIFWEDSDEEDDLALGDDFQAAPWLQGLSAQERLEEVFNVDAATRGMELLVF